MWLAGSQFPDQESNPGPRQWQPWALTTEAGEVPPWPVNSWPRPRLPALLRGCRPQRAYPAVSQPSSRCSPNTANFQPPGALGSSLPEAPKPPQTPFPRLECCPPRQPAPCFGKVTLTVWISTQMSFLLKWSRSNPSSPKGGEVPVLEELRESPSQGWNFSKLLTESEFPSQGRPAVTSVSCP